MRLVIVALFSVLVLSLIGAAVYQQYLLVPEPASPAQQTWLEQKLETISAPAGSSSAVGPSGPAAISSPPALGAVVGGIIGYAVRRGPIGIAVGALIGYLAGTGAFTALFSPQPPKPEPVWWQKLMP